MSAIKELFRVKSLEAYQRDADSSTMARELTGIDVALIGVGEVIGAGIFTVTGQAAALHAGPAIVLSFVISAIACGFAGLCYAEMAALVPVSGSAYAYAYATTGEIFGWIIGWDLMLEYAVGAATVSVGWSGYLMSFLQSLGIDLGTKFTQAPFSFADATGFTYNGGIVNAPAVFISLFCTVVLCFGAKQSAWINHALVAVKLSVILLFLFSTFSYIKTENWSPFIPPRTCDKEGNCHYGSQGVLRACVSVFFAFIGFDSVSSLAQECKNPKRDMPIGILGSLSVCTVLYVLVSLNLTGIAHYTTLNSDAPLATAVGLIGLNWLKIFISIGALAGLTSVILVSLMAQPRIFYSMARDGLLPEVFSRLHPKYNTPVLPTIISGTFCAIAGGLLPLDLLGDLTSAGTLFAFFLVSLSVMVLRFTRPDLHRPFRVPGGPILVPVLGAGSAMFLIVTTGTSTVLRLAIWMGVGFLIYFGYGYRHSRIRLESMSGMDGEFGNAPNKAENKMGMA
ncbi:amino acid/polyamine transporter I [Blastocladiella britannica]|nr:amino acid/polyamine transporter I [Blastocladiella britannica]